MAGHGDDRERWAALLQRQPKTQRRYGPGRPLLSLEQATAARRLAEDIGTYAAADRFHVSVNTLCRTWHRYGLAEKGRRLRLPLLTKAQAIEARALAAQIGHAATARHYGVAADTLIMAWIRYGIPRDFHGRRRGQRPPASPGRRSGYLVDVPAKGRF